MTEFQVKQLILENIEIWRKQINWYRKGKVIFVSYSPGEEII